MARPHGSLRPLGSAESLDDIEREWRAIEAQADCSFFLSWGWMGPWLATVRQSARIFVYTCRVGGETVGMAFFTLTRLTRRRGLVSTTQLQLNECSDPSLDMIVEYNGILSTRTHARDSWMQLPEALASAKLPWDELAFRSLGEEQLALARVALASLREEPDRCVPSWVVKLGRDRADGEILLAAFKKKTRQQMRQTLKEFDAMGRVDVELASGADESLAFFNEMRGLHTARWQRVRQRGSFSNRHWLRFHEAVISAGAARGDVRIVRVSCAGKPVGFIYGFVWKETFFAEQTGFQPQERTALRSGYLSHFRTMQLLAAHGVRGYDLLPDDVSSYKRHLAGPAGSFTTLRFQRHRVRFTFERILTRLWRRLRSARWLDFPNDDTANAGPAGDEDSR